MARPETPFTDLFPARFHQVDLNGLTVSDEKGRSRTIPIPDVDLNLPGMLDRARTQLVPGDPLLIQKNTNAIFDRRGANVSRALLSQQADNELLSERAREALQMLRRHHDLGGSPPVPGNLYDLPARATGLLARDVEPPLLMRDTAFEGGQSQRLYANAAINEWYGALSVWAASKLNSYVDQEIQAQRGDISLFNETVSIARAHRMFPDEFEHGMTVPQAQTLSRRLLRLHEARIIESERSRFRHFAVAGLLSPENFISFGMGKAVALSARVGATASQRAKMAALRTSLPIAGVVGAAEGARVALNPLASPDELFITVPVGTFLGTSLSAATAAALGTRRLARTELAQYRANGHLETGRNPC